MITHTAGTGTQERTVVVANLPGRRPKLLGDAECRRSVPGQTSQTDTRLTRPVDGFFRRHCDRRNDIQYQ
jgi:hypothetical protein